MLERDIHPSTTHRARASTHASPGYDGNRGGGPLGVPGGYIQYSKPGGAWGYSGYNGMSRYALPGDPPWHGFIIYPSHKLALVTLRYVLVTRWPTCRSSKYIIPWFDINIYLFDWLIVCLFVCYSLRMAHGWKRARSRSKDRTRTKAGTRVGKPSEQQQQQQQQQQWSLSHDTVEYFESITMECP